MTTIGRVTDLHVSPMAESGKKVSTIDLKLVTPDYVPIHGNEGQQMSTVSREEIDAKLQAIEAKMDTRLATIEGKFELMFHRMDEISSGLSSAKWWLIGATLTIILTALGTGLGIQQMTVTTFQAAAQQNTPAPQPVIINVPPPAQAPPAKP